MDKLKRILVFACLIFIYQQLFAQQTGTQPHLFLYGKNAVQYSETLTAQPLQRLGLINVKGSKIEVFDAKGSAYFSSVVQLVTTFEVGGALGKQAIRIYNAQNAVTDSLTFYVDAKTDINDGGYYKQMFDLFYQGMFTDAKDGTIPITWNGKTYHVFVQWTLDNFHTNKGLKYFLPNGSQLVDIMRQAQRDDGMIYSFIDYNQDKDYYLTRDKFSGYSKQIGDKVFVRQPVENHPEYVYVNAIYDCWKASADTAWMKQNLASAKNALDYALNDPARWSKRFGLLKRAYTIDSWDFAVEDEYMPDLGMTNSMIIDPVKTKFGVFFGDNTGYITTCYHLAEMFRKAGDSANAKLYVERADTITERLNQLAWNGHFFTHFIDEDTSVHRHLGVDEKSQIAQSNAYSLNRNISHEQSKAIIETYMNLKNHLPPGSPGEWYAIYPPFQKGFEMHDALWQYMNGGVGGHVAGELARGAYENGFEQYGTDNLNRIFELGEEYGNRISFAYTGAMLPHPSPPVFKTIDLSSYANMDLINTNNTARHKWMEGGRPGDDLHTMPVGEQLFDSIQFNIIDPAANHRNAVVAVANKKDLPSSVEIPVHDTVACIYLLHTAAKPESEGVAGAMKFMYEDGTSAFQYMMMGKQLTYWWFPRLNTDYSGIAWHGKNDVSEGIGISWCAIDNPHPEKKIKSLVVAASQNSNIYAVLAITLANQKHYVPVNPVSFGGPDYWAAATNMAAMVEGLAGIKDAPNSAAFQHTSISPRWITTSSDTVSATIRYAASDAYVCYQYLHNKLNRTINIIATTGGDQMSFHILLPPQKKAATLMINKKNIPFTQSAIEQSHYVDFKTDASSIQHIQIQYE